MKNKIVNKSALLWFVFTPAYTHRIYLKHKMKFQTEIILTIVPVEHGQSSLMQRNLAPRVYFVTLVVAMTKPSIRTGLMEPYMRGKLQRSKVYSGNGGRCVNFKTIFTSKGTTK